jgi:hypothetical protein
VPKCGSIRRTPALEFRRWVGFLPNLIHVLNLVDAVALNVWAQGTSEEEEERLSVFWASRLCSAVRLKFSTILLGINSSLFFQSEERKWAD